MNQSPGNNIPEDPIQREIEKLEEINKKQEQRVRNLETKSTQVINLYFVFQGVILTSVSNSSSLKCHNWWIPFSLSLLAAALNLYALVDNFSKIVKSKEEIDQAKADLGLMKLYGITKAQISQVLPGKSLNQPRIGQGTEIFRPKPDLARRWRLRAVVGLSIGLLVGFSGVIMYGCYIILCHSGNNGNCVKLC